MKIPIASLLQGVGFGKRIPILKSDVSYGNASTKAYQLRMCLLLEVVFRDTAAQRPLKSDTIARATEFAFLGVNGKVKRSVVFVQLWWHPPPENWYKLNSDGSSLGNPGRAGGGGLIRDPNGDWVCKYARIVVDLLSKDEGNMNDNDVIIADCKEGLRRLPRVRIQHCFREANKCADTLARRGSVNPQDFVIYQSPPTDVAMLASLDAVGTLYKRNRSLFFVF
nr:putative ribonuclease h protein [Quercus suber]